MKISHTRKTYIVPRVNTLEPGQSQRYYFTLYIADRYFVKFLAIRFKLYGHDYFIFIYFAGQPILSIIGNFPSNPLLPH